MRKASGAFCALALALAACAHPPSRPVRRVTLPAALPEREPVPPPPKEPPPRPVELSPAPLEPTSLSRLSVAWSEPARAWATAKSAAIMVVIEPRGDRLIALDARDGSPRWKVKAPSGTRFTDVAVGRASPFGVVVGRSSSRSYFVARFELEGGKLSRRTRLNGAARLQIGEDGGVALVDRDACRARLWNPQSGRWLGGPLAGSIAELKDFRGKAAGSCRMTVAVHALAKGVAVAGFLELGHAVLAGFDENGERWRLALNGDIVKGLAFEGEQGVFAGIGIVGSRSSVLRVELATGRVIWRHEASGCALGGPNRVRVVPAGGARGILFAHCRTADLLRLADGSRAWRRDVSGEPVIVGEPASSISLPETGSRTVQWLGPDGAPGGRLTLPSSIARVVPLAGGLLVINKEQNVVALLERDGRPRWQYRVESGSVRIVDGSVALLGPHSETLIDPQTGQAEAATLEAPWAIGRTSGSPAIWLSTSSGPSRVLGLRL